MREVATNVFLLRGFPPYAVNVYLIGSLLVDAGTQQAGPGILRQLRGRRVVAHVLTHVHPDHQGASRRVCTARHIPLWCGDHDADAMNRGSMDSQFPEPQHWLIQTMGRFWAGPAHSVTRRLSEGDQLGDFTVIETPGHTPGHISLWRERDRVLILGDVANNGLVQQPVPNLQLPPPLFTVDPILNRASARKVAALRPAIVCFGHGPPLYDKGEFAEFVAREAEM
jgi:glyoxylase-like metal-dependent hydrolase (beta-lactamase superfamily II)